MIDIHSHILPAMDDGPRTLKESVELVKTAFQNGVHIMIATPHVHNGVYHSSPQEIIDACGTLNIALKKKDIFTKVLPGSEVRLFPELIEHCIEKRVMTLNNGPFMLLELPHQFLLKPLTATIKKLKVLGITPIIAHPERNKAIINNLDTVSELIFNGALIQITSGSLLGLFGKRAKLTAKKLIQNENVHFLASDTHSLSDIQYGLAQGAEQLKKIAGEKSNNILAQYPEKILLNIN